MISKQSFSNFKNIGILKSFNKIFQIRFLTFQKILRLVDVWEVKVLDSEVWNHPIYKLLIQAFVCFLIFLLIATPLDLYQQLFFGFFLYGLALYLRKFPNSRIIVIMLMALSISVSIRYMYWRITSTLHFENVASAFFGYGLILAEIYALLVLLLGFVQTAWPLRRKPAPLPKNSEEWPTVDIFLPTYNEPLSVVSLTILAAQALDWPADKFKIYVLDDGKRPEFREFCQQAGVGYLTREGNIHNKAGNLNSALKQTDGEYVAIFDCDHIPTRSFLQITMGWFLRDPLMAMMQTPHYFFSPDPFEKNLGTFRKVPNEGDLFYGLVQDGNDFWNASFFCGSCAVLRRSMLIEVGGIAVETVTEDAHTALKLSRKGYNIGYLAIPQAAGLATESLSGHIRQRVRWARGMGQIFRVDNPLLGKGLSIGQRMCYLNAMLHFFYGLPRLIFLTAPLAYLIFGASIFDAKASMIIAYAFPHIFIANIANSKIQGAFRHSYWNEVYETVLAWYIMLPVFLALINPKLGAFNVTAKGGLVEKDYYDWKLARPYIIILILSFIGVGHAFYRLFTDEANLNTVLINLAWVLYNITITSASASVANEAKQIRSSPRVDATLPATILLPNGKTIACETTDFSNEGVSLKPPQSMSFPSGLEVKISLFRGNREYVLPGIVRRSGNLIGIQFANLSLEQRRDFTQITFSRADTWATTWGKGPVDSPLKALQEVLKYGLLNLIPLFRRAIVYETKEIRDSIGEGAISLKNQLLNKLKGKTGESAQPHSESATALAENTSKIQIIKNKLKLPQFNFKLPLKGIQNTFSFKLPIRFRFRQNKTHRKEE